MSIRNKIIILVIVSIMLTVSAIATMVYFQSRNFLISTFAINAQAQSERMKDFTNKFLDDGRMIISYLSKHPDIINATGKLHSYIGTTTETPTQIATLSSYEKNLASTFEHYTSTNPSYFIMYTGLEDGSFVQYPDDSLPAGYDPRTRTWYRAALQDPNKVALSEGYLSTNNTIVYTLSKAVRDGQGKTVGVVALDINVDVLSKFFEKIKIGKTGHAILVESNSSIISDSEAPGNMGKKLAELNEPGLEKAFQLKEGALQANIKKDDHLVYVTTTPDGWRFITLMDEEEATGAAVDNLVGSVGVGTGFAIFMIIISLFMVRSIVAPINKLVNAAKAVAQGNLEAVGRNEIYTGELSSLHTSMVDMVDQLAKVIKTAQDKTQEAEAALIGSKQALQDAEQARNQALQAKSEGMRSAADSLTEVVHNIDQAAQALSGEIDYSSNGTVEQAARIAQTASAMNKMNMTVMDVARSASSASSVANLAREKATTGAKAMQEVVDDIHMVETNAQAMQEDMTKLEQHAQAISHIMSVISDIADQTNLLALNAAIEAARAGEAGRGFAVVADEVRKLAEKTMISTTDVGNAIKAIQESVSKSRVQMDNAVQGITLTTGKAKASGENLNEIQQMVEQAQTQVQAITAASREQSQISEEVTQDVTMVNEIANNTANSMQTSYSIVKKLAQQADELNHLIVQMKQG